jgi:hypothetical protein
MSIRRLAAPAIVAALGLLTFGTASSPAANTTVRTDPSGGMLTGATTLRNTSSDLAVFATSAGSITCNQASFDARLTANTSTSIIGGQLTAMTFTACTDTLSTIDIEDCALHTTAPHVRLTSIMGGGTFSVIDDPVMRCKIAGMPTACYFTFGSLAGPLLNIPPSTLTFTNQGVTAVSTTADAVTPANCGNGSFSTVFTHIVDDLNKTITVTMS